jgi:hypothetical protein
MAVQTTAPVVATTELDLWVPRDATDNLQGGVRAVIGDVDGVETVEVTAITDVRPRATDIRVTATVWLVFERGVDVDVRETLEDGFGIQNAEVLVEDRTEP